MGDPLVAKDEIRVLLADDHAVVREGTRRILQRQAGVRIVGEAGDGEAAVTEALRLQPDVAILDIRMPALNGVDAARRIRETCPDTAVLVLSAYDDDDYVFALMEAGASGYILKTARTEELVAAVRAVARGEPYLDHAIAQKVARLWARKSQAPARPDESLTSRELEVLRLVARGFHNKEIAQALSVSIRTVEGHLNAIFIKLSVESRTEAVVRAVGARLLHLEAQA